MTKLGHVFKLATLLVALPVFLSSCGDDRKATITLQLRDFSFEVIDGLNRFTHNREFREHEGVGVTLTKGKVCVENNKTCVSAEVNYRIDAQSLLRQKGHHFATSLDQDVVTLEYWGIDDNGNPVNLQMALEINGQDIRIK